MANQESWQPNGPSLSGIMTPDKDDKLLTDIQFVIGKEPSKTFHAHKTILASGSPVFKSMFYGKMPEQKNPIVVEDDDPEAFDMLLNYIYGKGDTIRLNSYPRAWKYHSIGDKYLVEGITEGAKEFIKSSCMKEEVFWNLIESGLFGEPIFQEKFNDYLQQNTDKILNTENALQMPGILVEDILRRDTLNVSEYELLKFTAKWVNSNVASSERSIQTINFFQHIRFSILSLEDFCDFTHSFPDLISAENCVQIFKHLCKHTYNLPDWCSTNDDYRCFKSYFSVLENGGVHNDSHGLVFA